MKHSFTFNGIVSSDLKITVQKLPPRPIPNQRMTSYTIPGRSGTLHTTDGSYESFVMAIECVVTDSSKILDICIAYQGSGKLTHDGMAGYYYNATVLNTSDIARMSSRWGIFQIQFECQPFRYHESNNMILMDTPGGGDLFWHFGSVDTQPVLKVFGSGNLSFTITRLLNAGGSSLATTTYSVQNVSSYVFIDSNSMIVYKTTASKLSDFSSSDGMFPTLSHFGNSFVWATPGGISKIEVTPNWRSL